MDKLAFFVNVNIEVYLIKILINKITFVSEFVIINMVNKKNPFAIKAKSNSPKKGSGKRIGKSKPSKANNQLNRRVK